MSSIIKESDLSQRGSSVVNLDLREFVTPQMLQEKQELRERLEREAEQAGHSIESERMEIVRTKAEADGMLQRARVQAKALVQDAEKNAAQKIAEAEQTVESIRQEGLRKGYEEGLEQARAEAEAKYRAIAEEELAQIKTVVLSFTQSYHDLQKQAEHALVKLAMDIAAKVIQEEAQKHEELVLKMVKTGLERVVEKSNIVVKVNPDQLEMVKHHREQLMHMVENVDSFEMLPDSRVAKGGCIVETGSGSVEVRIEKQIQEIHKALTGEDREETDVSDGN